MTVKEYNEIYHPKINHALSFIGCLEHAMSKTSAYEEAMKQLRCIGWSEELVQTFRTALECYRKSLLQECKTTDFDPNDLTKMFIGCESLEPIPEGAKTTAALLSHIRVFEVEEDLGFAKIRKKVLFNQNKITEDEALRHVQADEYNDNVIVLNKRQWRALFLDKECENDG